MSTSRIAAAAEPVTTWRAEVERRWNAVETWRATAVIEVRAGNAAASQHSRCEFVIDRPRRCLRWNVASADDVAHSGGIVKHGSVSRIGGHAGAGNAVVTVSGLSDLEATLELAGHDPIVWLTAGLTDTPSAFARPGGPLDLSGWQTDQETSEHRSVRRSGVEATITVDPQTGTIAAVRKMEHGTTEELKLLWERHGEVWAPVEITKLLTGPNIPASQTRIEFQNSVVNEPVDPVEWSLSAIGAMDGDLVQDRSREAQFVFHGRAAADAQTTDPSHRTPRAVILNVSVWVVILVSILLFRRRRAATTVGAGAAEINDASHPED